MKTNLIKLSSFVLFTMFLTLSQNAMAQKEITWKGGTPGMKNDWNCPTNWSTSSIPDEFSNVIIPDVSTSTFSSPIIKTGKVEVNSIFIQSNATMTVAKDAVVVVYDDIRGACEGNMHVDGILILHGANAAFTMEMIASRIK